MSKRRNHPLYIVRQMTMIIKQIFVPIVLGILAILKNASPKMIIISGVVLFIVILLLAIISWRKNIYYIENDMLITEKGILVKSKQAVAFEKITTINENQKLLEKIFGLVTVKLDAGSVARGNEIQLTISHSEAELLCQQLTEKRQSVMLDAAMTETMPLAIAYRLNSKGLFKYAIANANFLLGIILVTTALQFLDNIPIIGDMLKHYFNGWENVLNKVEFQSYPIRTWFALGFVILMLYLVISFILSVITTFVKYHGFTLSRQANDLKISYGLIGKKRFTISANKITALYITYSPLGMLVNLGELKIENIGYGDEKGEVAVLFPIIRKQKIDNLLSEVLPEFLVPEVEWIRPHNKAKLSYMIRYAFLPLIGSIVLSAIYKFGYLAFAVTLFMAFCGYLAHRHAGMQTVDNKGVFTRGIFGKKITIIRNSFFQSYMVSQNPFQQRNDLINIKYSYQSNNFGRTIGVKGMDRKELSSVLPFF